MGSEKSIHKRFRENYAGIYNRVTRVENPIAPGMPDTNCCFLGIGEFWIELKSPTEPKRATTPLFGSNHKVSQEQINWHRHQQQCGGRSFFLIDTDKRVILMHGRWAEKINAMTVDQLVDRALYSATKPMRKSQWDEMKIYLSC